MELDDTEVFEADDEGGVTTSYEDIDSEYCYFGFIVLEREHALDNNDVVQRTVLTCINEVADRYPRKLLRKLKVVCESLCNILRSNKPQMVFKAYQTIRNLSQLLKSPFYPTYWKYLKISFNNLLSPVQATVDYALQMIYEMHSSFDPTYFIKTLKSALGQTQNVNLKMNFSVCLYQLLCHQKSNITQYCPTYFELFLTMTDKSKPLKEVCKETGKYLLQLYGKEEVENILTTYYREDTINKIQEILCFKSASRELLRKTSSKPKKEEGEDDDDNEENKGSTEPEMSAIKIGQHKFIIKKQSPTLIPSPTPFYPNENNYRRSKYYNEMTKTQMLRMQSRSASPQSRSTSPGKSSASPSKPVRSSSAPIIRKSTSTSLSSSPSRHQPTVIRQSSIGKQRVSDVHLLRIEKIKRSLLSKYKYNIRNKSINSRSDSSAKKNNTTTSNRSSNTYNNSNNNNSKRSISPSKLRRSMNQSSPSKSTYLNSTYSRSETSRSRSRSPLKAKTSNTQATLNKIFKKARKEREEREKRLSLVTGKSPVKKSYKRDKLEKQKEQEIINNNNDDYNNTVNRNEQLVEVSQSTNEIVNNNNNNIEEEKMVKEKVEETTTEEEKRIEEKEEEEEEEDDEFKDMTAEELFEELLKNISDEDRIKYQDQIITAREILDCFESDSDYNSYSSSSNSEEEDGYDNDNDNEEVEEENIKTSKLDQSPIDEEKENNDDDYEWNITDDEFIENENP